MIIFTLLLVSFSVFADPLRYTELLDYVQPAPDQGETNTCMFMSSTGAVELLANKKAGIINPVPMGPFDLSESYPIYAASFAPSGKSWHEDVAYRFNGSAIHNKEWPYKAWLDDGSINYGVWEWRDSSAMPKVNVPLVETIRLFIKGKKYATNVLGNQDIQNIKEALVQYRSPVLINYNDDSYWHMILIVGFDDELQGDCYEISEKECSETRGSFYVRDSGGVPVEVRDYDWFKIKGNAAFVVKEKEL